VIGESEMNYTILQTKKKKEQDRKKLYNVAIMWDNKFVCVCE